MKTRTLVLSVVLILTVLVLLGGCASVQKSGGFVGKEKGKYYHIHSGVEFPNKLDGWHRRDIMTLDSSGYEIAVTYDKYDPFRAVMTIYVYQAIYSDTSSSLDEEFISTKEAIFQSHSDAKLQSEKKSEGIWLSSFVYVDNFMNEEQLVSSMLILSMDMGWYIKNRVTFSLMEAGEKGIYAIEDFLGNIPLLWASIEAPTK